MSDILLGGVGTAGVAGSYPASIVTTGLQTVYDQQVGGSVQIGPRSATTKTLGIDTLPAGFTYDGRFLRGTGTATMSNWDLSTIANNGYVYTDGTGVVTFNDCIFGFHPSSIVGYSLVSGDSGTPNTVCNYCRFDGDRLLLSSPSAPFLANLGDLQLNYCDIVDQPADGGKQNGGTFTARNSRWQSCGWYNGSDPDCLQIGGGSADVQYCIFDVRDGSSLGASFPGQGLNNFFRAESFAAAIPSIIFKNNVCIGNAAFSAVPSPHNGGIVSIDAKDVNPNTITSVLYQNNVIEKGSGPYTYQDGTSRYPHLTGSEWLSNLDYVTGSTIAVP